MAARSRWRRGRTRGQESGSRDRVEEGKGSSGRRDSASPQTTLATSTEPSPKSAPETIRKGVYLSALIYVEGEQPPPDDFTRLATDALREALQAALEAKPSGLDMTLKGVEVQNDVEEDGEDEEDKSVGGSDGKAHGKFQF